MDVKDIQKIIDILKNSDVNEFELEQDGTTIRIARGQQAPVVMSAPQAPQHFNYHMSPGAMPPVAAPVAPVSVTTAATAPVVAVEIKDDPSLVKVESPIVGTFYSRPSPDANVFVEVGKSVKKGDTLCIIEAMKLMNPIESPVSGVVEKILLTDKQVVEYGEVLFLIRPA